ncbi:MAG: hypothetical protein IPK71_15940 [Myxococcales bacterium]|jgi:hypothetical protein|nr:hypothetical protein [Myxococcales bacterium]
MRAHTSTLVLGMVAAVACVHCGLLESVRPSPPAPTTTHSAAASGPRRLEYCVDANRTSPDAPSLGSLAPELRARLTSHEYKVLTVDDRHIVIELPANALPFDDDQAANEVRAVLRRHKGPSLAECRTEHYENAFDDNGNFKKPRN